MKDSSEPTPTTMEASSSNEATGNVMVPCEAPTRTISTGAPPPTSEDIQISKNTKNLIDLISGDLHYVNNASTGLKDYGVKVSGEIQKVTESLKKLKLADPSTYNLARLHDLEKIVVNLKLQIPSKYKPQSDARRRKRLDELEGDGDTKYFPILSKRDTLERSLEFKDFMSVYETLGSDQKVCLLSFSVFPENEIIRKRLMIHWWIAEGFVRPKSQQVHAEKTAEELAEELAGEVFKELMKKDLIQPFHDKPSLEVKWCKMHPFIRSSLVILAIKANSFHFDSTKREKAAKAAKDSADKAKAANDTAEEAKTAADSATAAEAETAAAKARKKADDDEEAIPAHYATSHQACLLLAERFEDKPGIEKIHVLFNVDETEIDFEQPDTLFKMESLNILCLGRWQHSPIHHIELEEKHLEGIKNMKFLKLLSLQGISRIMVLPGSIFCLPNLTILDLRACHSLEKIPKEIGLLKSLTYLDMSECYLLESMPREISDLSELQVLKGFVVMNYSEKEKKVAKYCAIKHLSKLKKLKKLSIHTGRNEFPDMDELKYLRDLSRLRKLTIAWGRGMKNKAEPNPVQDTTTTNAAKASLVKQQTFKEKIKRRASMLIDKKVADNTDPELPIDLEKLDLQSFPRVYAPGWLRADKLKKLKKLYIRGGTLRDLGQNFIGEERQRWEKVEILRVKYLKRLEMDWRELQDLFPRLTYLEKVDCPKLTLFPCDGRGIWKKDPETFNLL